MKKWGGSAVVALLLAWCAPVAAQSDRELATRLDFIQQAGALSDQGKHVEALALYKRAAAIKPTPSLRLVLAREELALGLLADAYGSGRQCAVEAEADMALRDRERILAACRELEESLGKRVGRVTVTLPTPAPPNVHVSVSGDEIGAALIGAPYVVTPGKVAIAVTATGYLPFTSDVDVVEGGAAQVNVQLVLDPSAQPCAEGQERVHGACVAVCTSGRVRTVDESAQCCWRAQTWSPAAAACVGAPECPSGLVARGEECVALPAQVVSARAEGPSDRGVGPLVLGAAGVVMGALATGSYLDAGSKYSSLKALCTTVPPGCTTAQYNAAGSTIQRNEALGVAGWIAAGGLIASGAVWYALSATKEGAPAPAGARLVVNPLARSVGVAGVF